MEQKIVTGIKTLIAGKDLTPETAADSFSEIMNGTATEAQTAAFLTALSIKGETPSEIAACADVMRSCAEPVQTEEETLEIVGTGGDKTGTFNISTASAIVCAAAGVKTAKHGNRSVSSRSGAADCLEALGYDITLEANESAQMLDRTGFCFMFAPVYHKAMKNAAPVRKQLAVPTVFNILGPLANPACATRQLLGVYSDDLIDPMAETLDRLGVRKGLVVHSREGLDEISNTGSTSCCLTENGKRTHFKIKPQISDINGRTLKKYRDRTRRKTHRSSVISSQENRARAATSCMNAGAALMLAGTCATIADGRQKSGNHHRFGPCGTQARRNHDDISGTGNESFTERERRGMNILRQLADEAEIRVENKRKEVSDEEIRHQALLKSLERRREGRGWNFEKEPGRPGESA